MKLVFINKLKGNEILRKSIVDREGNILLKGGVRLTHEYINKLRNYGVFFVYIEDKLLEDVTQDIYLDEMKQNILQKIPNLFNGFIEYDENKIRASLSVIEELTDYISKTRSININLYEVKAYDDYTYIHCVDTCIMAIFLGEALNLSRSELIDLGTSALLHDIGKTKISNSVINKKERLSKEEFDEIRRHPIYGAQILKKSNLISDSIIRPVLEHHERIDGKGYPFGLTEDKISYWSKIVSVCDVYTAVSANRSYRPRFSPNEAYELVLSGANIMFDDKIVNAFRRTFAVYPLGCCVRLSNGTEGYVVKQNENFADKPIIRVLYDSVTKNPIQPYEIDLVEKINVVIESVVI